MDVYGEFEWRGLIHDATEGARDALSREKVTGYIGFDPSAPSLHVGSLLVVMVLAHLQRAGSSHTAPASVLPNFVPAAVVTSGITMPCAFPPRTRRINSIPAVMLPH